MIDRDNRTLENVAYHAWDSINELLKTIELTDEDRKKLKDANEILFTVEKVSREKWLKNEQMDGWSEAQ